MKKRSAAIAPAVFPPMPPLEKRPLLRADQARDLMNLFKIFGSDTRLRLLHALVRNRELCVTDLAKAVGMKPQAVSNQLQRLVDRGILGFRREGNSIYYRIADPCVPILLDRGMCLIECNPETPEESCCESPSAIPGRRKRKEVNP